MERLHYRVDRCHNRTDNADDCEYIRKDDLKFKAVCLERKSALIDTKIEFGTLYLHTTTSFS